MTGSVPTAPLAGVRTMSEVHHVSSARAIEELGATFRPFEETARDVLAWYEHHGTYQAPPAALAPARAR